MRAIYLASGSAFIAPRFTNGPAATIGEVLDVGIARPRNRVALAEDARYLQCRKAVIDFLYTRQGHVERAA